MTLCMIEFQKYVNKIFWNTRPAKKLQTRLMTNVPSIAEDSKCVVEDHYQLEVPFREENALSDNSSVCINDVSLQWLDLLQPLFHILAGVNKV